MRHVYVVGRLHERGLWSVRAVVDTLDEALGYCSRWEDFVRILTVDGYRLVGWPEIIFPMAERALA